MSDPEDVLNTAYADAYAAARGRAEAYAAAADMEIRRVLYIRDAGGQQGRSWVRGAQAMDEMAESVVVRTQAMAPPPPVNTPAPESGSPGMMVGTTRTNVHIQVDFALREK